MMKSNMLLELCEESDVNSKLWFVRSSDVVRLSSIILDMLTTGSSF